MAILSPSAKQQFFDANGNPLVGGKLYTYAAGTTTPLATYTDSTGGTANSNPIILDSRGEANVWLASGTAYKFALQSATSVAIWTVDNIDATLGTMASQNANNVAITGGSITGLTAFTTTNGATIQGLTVGKGAGSVSTNTAVGASALAANSTGPQSVAVGYEALLNSTGGYNTALGYQAGKGITTPDSNTAIGRATMAAGTASGGNNTAVGNYSMNLLTTGTGNTAVGDTSLRQTTTGSNNTAIGKEALQANTTAGSNTAVGYQSMYSNTTGVINTGIGYSALYSNTTGNFNIAVGQDALKANTTASNNTAVGYQAGYTNSTGVSCTYIGRQAGYTATGNYNTALGSGAGYGLTTGTVNTLLGINSGQSITTGSNNTVVGSFSGNQGGLDIRTASNRVVMSDGDGNPVFVYGAYPASSSAYLTNASAATIGLGGTGTTGTGSLYLSAEAASGWGPLVAGCANGTAQWYLGSNSYIKGGTTYSTFTVTAGGFTGGVNLTSGATAWTSASDERLKDIIEPITDAATKVSTLRAVIGKYKDDEEGKRRSFLIAQDVQAVLPEAVTEGRNAKDDETEYLQLAYTEVIPLLVAAIKELKAEIDQLKGQA